MKNKKNNMKRTICMIMCIVMTLTLLMSIVACTWSGRDEHDHNHETEVVETTEAIETTEAESVPAKDIAEALTDAVEEAMIETTDIKEIAQKIVDGGVLEFSCVVEDIESNTDFMMGMTKPVEGFTECEMIVPIISSQPFVTYLFKTDDVEALKADAMAKANKAWNICTEASEIVCESYGDVVLFAMVP